MSEAEKLISSLDPHPGRAFQSVETVRYVRPDVFVVETDGELKVILNEYYLPRISINSYYERLLKESPEKETRIYLKDKMQQARRVMYGLETRGSTLYRCAEAILLTQKKFFAGQTKELAPMGLAGLSEELSLHPSTISRATREKYLQCRQGTYPLRYFFSGAVGEEGLSQQAVKHRLLELIQEEPAVKPYSDQRLSDLLSGQGIQIARRTVAKYRIQLGIPSAAVRKRNK